MTVTFARSSGTSLGDPAEPIVFSTTASIIPVISAKFGGATSTIEERVYRDGAFLYPYQASTRVVNTFTLIRAGGWPRIGTPAQLAIYVYEDTGDAEPATPGVVTGAGDRVVTGAGDRVVP